jgi:ubiquinone biosynthesis protein
MNHSATVSERRSFAERLIGGPEGFRLLLQRLGPTFTKIGQFLALRPDLIPQEYSDELLRLLDDVEPFPWSEAEAIIQEDLGAPLELFRSINPRPIAAGSMAQVHAAVLWDGTRAAVKVLRPGIAESVRVDLRRARAFARLLHMANVDLVVSPRELVQELEIWLEKEIDLRNELNHMIRLRNLTCGSHIQVIPKPYPGLCSQRVLTAEYLRGVPFLEVLRALDEGGEQEVQRRGFGLRLDELAENVIESTLRQIFRYQFFHADVHPGNLIALPNQAIGYVDFGLCEEIDESVRREQVRYLSTVYEGDAPQMFQALLEVLTPGEGADVEAFRIDFMAACSKWLGRTPDDVGDSRGTRSPVANCMIAVVRAARRNRFIIPTRLLAMYRTLLTAETVAHQLSPSVDLRSVGKEFFISLQTDEALASFSPEAQRALLPKILALLRDSPGPIHQILSELAEGRFRLRTETIEDAATQRVKNRRARMLAAAILSVGFAFLLSAPSLPAIGPLPLRPVIMVALALVYVSVLVQWHKMK